MFEKRPYFVGNVLATDSMKRITFALEKAYLLATASQQDGTNQAR
jgi:hypothetical protein